MKLSTLSVLTPYLFSTASLAILILAKESVNRTKNLILAFLAFVFSIWIIIGCGQEVVFFGFILLVIGIPFYVLLKKNNTKSDG
jgi:APA family basic amino acid/polyamine antiporter